MPSKWARRGDPSAEVIYALCALTSVACAAVLATSYRRKRERLLLWSTACFGGLA
jgi:hypothetical protein